MKEVWLIADGEWEEAKEALKDAIEIGFDGAFVRREFVDRARKLGRINVVALEDALITIRSAEDQRRALEKDLALLGFEDWKVIPLENIVAMKRGKAIAIVESFDDAKLALTTLEKGVDGIAVRGSREELRKYYELVKSSQSYLELKLGKVREVKPLGLGERVCVDTVTLMSVGEGMLVGNQANFMFLVASESEESEYVASRPFRVNAGSVNAYVKVGDRTRYLAELRAGDEVEIVRHDGRTRTSYVGRVKIERRPLILVRAEAEGFEGSIILQNAETIKLVTKNGKHLSVAELKEGDEVLVWLGKAGRHFGVEVEEFIVER
ncbi:MAG: 3-dehydroquinate synthase II [Archaeoglobaceae archaeon]